MEMETHLDNKKIYNILAISGILLTLIAFFIKYDCIFKNIFKIPCISCGLTRGIKSILKLNIIEAIKYNLLSIPIFILSITFYILYILYLFNIKKYLDNLYSFFVRNYKIFLILLLTIWIINIVKVM